MKKILLLTLLVLISGSLIACHDFDIILNHKMVTLGINETIQLKATINTEEEESDIIWSSSHPNIAYVDDLGLVTTLLEGETLIVAKLPSGDTSSCQVIVSDSLAKLKREVKATIAAEVNKLSKDNYSPENWAQIQGYIVIAFSTIELLTDEDLINDLKESTLELIENVPTKDLEEAKVKAKDELDIFIEALDKEDYDNIGIISISLYKLEYNYKINDAKTITDINELLQEAIMKIQSISTKVTSK